MVSRESSQKVASFGRQLEAVKIFNTRIPLGLKIMFYERTLVETRDHNSILDAVSKNRGTPKWMVYNGKPY